MLPQGLLHPAWPAPRPRHSPPHQRLVDCGPQVKDMVADGQVVLKAEGLQHHAVPHGEREPQLVIVGGWVGEEPMSHRPLAATGAQKRGLRGRGWGSLTHMTCTLGCVLRGTHRCGCKHGHRSWAVWSSTHQRAVLLPVSRPHPAHPCLLLPPTGSPLWKPRRPLPAPSRLPLPQPQVSGRRGGLLAAEPHLRFPFWEWLSSPPALSTCPAPRGRPTSKPLAPGRTQAGRGGRSPGGGGRALIFGLMSGGKGGLTSWLGDRYGGMLLPGVMGGVGFPGTGEWG